MLQKPRQRALLNKAGDVAHKSIVAACIGLSFYGMYGIGMWFYQFHNMSEELKKNKLQDTIENLRSQDCIEIKDIAKSLDT
ncbi:hypothetical protein WDU94_010610 [Cyamophila willieti]